MAKNTEDMTDEEYGAYISGLCDKVMDFIIKDLGVTRDSEILTVITAVVASAIYALGENPAIVGSKEEARNGLVDLMFTLVKEEMKHITISPKDTEPEGDKPIILN